MNLSGLCVIGVYRNGGILLVEGASVCYVTNTFYIKLKMTNNGKAQTNKPSPYKAHKFID
jgi:hypothetical protein